MYLDKETILVADYIVTYKDEPNTASLLFHIPGLICNLDCYKCHNKYFSKQNKKPYYTYNELKDILKKAKLMQIESIIISGGEPTLLLSPLIELLEFIKDFGFKFIRIDTNGTKPDAVKYLLEKALVTHFAIDVKIPLDVENSRWHENLELWDQVLFSGKKKFSEVIEYTINLKQTFEYLRLAKNLLKRRILLRTVKYPQYTPHILDWIYQNITELEFPYEYQVNQFYEPEKL